MIRKMAGYISKYKAYAVLTPLMVILEVLLK